MLTERKEYNSLPPFEREGPFLPLLDTQEIIDCMPKGKWQIPKEPYTVFEKIRENDLDFIKRDKIKRFQTRCREIVSEWIPFFDAAEKGYEIGTRAIHEGILTGDSKNIENYLYLNRAFEPIFHEDKNRSFEESVSSVRNAFLFLLTKEQVEKLGHERPKKVSKDDAINAKHLVNCMVDSYI